MSVQEASPLPPSSVIIILNRPHHLNILVIENSSNLRANLNLWLKIPIVNIQKFHNLVIKLDSQFSNSQELGATFYNYWRAIIAVLITYEHFAKYLLKSSPDCSKFQIPSSSTATSLLLQRSIIRWEVSIWGLVAASLSDVSRHIRVIIWVMVTNAHHTIKYLPWPGVIITLADVTPAMCPGIACQ